MIKHCRCNCHQQWWIDEGLETHADCSICFQAMLEEEWDLSARKERIKLMIQHPLNEILSELETTGAGPKTAAQDGPRLAGETGVQASIRMAKADEVRVMALGDRFIAAGEAYGLPPALLAAIASRESRCGAILKNGWGDRGNAFGIMQIDRRWHVPVGESNSVEHLEQAAGLLKSYLGAMEIRHDDWKTAQQLKGAVAAYNCGVPNVRTIEHMDIGTTGDDYSSDVWARARYYAGIE